MIDNEYSQDYQYYKGQYCVYNGVLYRAKNDIPVGTPFSTDNWEYRQIGLDLYQMNTGLSDSFKIINTSPVNVTTNQNGYASITPPTTPTGYTLLATALHYWSSMTTPSAISIDTPGTYILSSANNSIQALRVRYIYVKTSQVSS